jgi:hypothetical protein
MKFTSHSQTRNERFRQFLVGLAVAIIMVSLPTIAYQEYTNNQSQDNHHAATTKQNKRLASLEQEVLEKDDAIRNAQKVDKTTLTEIAALQKEVATVIVGLPPADASLATFAVWIEGCLSTGDCSSPPKL